MENCQRYEIKKLSMGGSIDYQVRRKAHHERSVMRLTKKKVVIYFARESSLFTNGTFTVK